MCPLASEAWGRHLGRGTLSDDPHTTFIDWLLFHVLDFREKEGLSSLTLVRFLGILWAIWITRNHQVFRQTRTTLEGLQLQVNIARDQHQVFSAQTSAVGAALQYRLEHPLGFLMNDLGKLSSRHPQMTFRIDGSWEASSNSGTSAWVASHGTSSAQNMQGQKLFASSALQAEIYACQAGFVMG